MSNKIDRLHKKMVAAELIEKDGLDKGLVVCPHCGAAMHYIKAPLWGECQSCGLKVSDYKSNLPEEPKGYEFDGEGRFGPG